MMMTTMTIYDDIPPARPQHMNEDLCCPWKQCENSRCRRIFNVHSEGMVVQTIRWGDGLEGKPTNPNGPTFTRAYCLQCAERAEKDQIEFAREKMQELREKVQEDMK
jgi:hypothetical protein